MRRSRLKPLIASLASFVAVFGGMWGFLDAFGVQGSTTTAAAVLVACLLAILLFDYFRLRFEVLPELRHPRRFGCCVLNKPVETCPVGIAAIHKAGEQTIRTSLDQIKHTFMFFGLSAFNVIHNNMDRFRNLLGKQIRFVLLSDSPSMMTILKTHDQSRPSGPTTLSSQELVKQGADLANRLATEMHGKATIVVKRSHVVHTFRVVNVDNRTIFVSFYDQSSDVLRSHQLELSADIQSDYSIFEWFRQFAERIERHHAVHVRDESKSDMQPSQLQ